METIISTVVNTIGVVIVAVYSNKANKKIDTLSGLKEDLKNEIDSVRREQDKTYLTDFLSDVENGQKKSQIQVRRAYEVYEEYKKLNRKFVYSR